MAKDILELAVQCGNCGQWKAMSTTNVHKFQFVCFSCGKVNKLRSMKGWNVNYKRITGNPDVEKIPVNVLITNLNASVGEKENEKQR